MPIMSVYLFLVAFFAAAVAVPLLQEWAAVNGKLDYPGDRKVHLVATPRLGGVAIFLAFLLPVLVFVDVSREIRGMLAGALVMFLVGLFDDLVGLSARKKLAGQVLAVVLTIMISGFMLRDLGNLFGNGHVFLPLWLAFPFTVFAVVGMTNAINMIDGLDGLAGGVSVIALVAFFLLYNQSGNLEGALLCAALIGATLGFLKYNSYPANIFMGDAGSLVLGFLLAFFSIDLTQGAGANISPAVPVLVLGLPIFDTLNVMSRRLLSRRNPFSADRTHVHHRVLELGLGHRATVIVIYGFTFTAAIVAMLLQHQPEYLLLSAYGAVIVLLYALIQSVQSRMSRIASFSQDASSSLRSSRIYRRMARTSRWVIPGLLICVYAYFAYSMIAIHRENVHFTRLGLVLGIGGMLLTLIPQGKRNRFIMGYFVASALLLTLMTEFQHEVGAGYIDFDSLRLGNVIFALIAFLVVVKLVFRNDSELYLYSPLDYLFLALTLSLAVFPGEVRVLYHLPAMIIKSVLLILALKILSAQNRHYARLAHWGVTATMTVVVVRSLI